MSKEPKEVQEYVWEERECVPVPESTHKGYYDVRHAKRYGHYGIAREIDKHERRHPTRALVRKEQEE